MFDAAFADDAISEDPSADPWDADPFLPTDDEIAAWSERPTAEGSLDVGERDQRDSVVAHGSARSFDSPDTVESMEPFEEPKPMPSKANKINGPRRSARALVGNAWLTACLLTATFLLGLGASRSPVERHAQSAPTTISRSDFDSLTSAGGPEHALATKPIEQVRVGDRVTAHNPLISDSERTWSDPDPKTWRKLDLRLPRSGGHLAITMLRPPGWFAETGAVVGGTIDLDLPEMALEGAAEVLAIGPCPPFPPGLGAVVTATFAHLPADDLLDIHVDGLASPIGCTPTHPFWSEDRHDFIPASDLHIGERLRTARAGIRPITSITPRPHPEPVYNLEVHGEHVYQVSGLGVLVHNVCPVPTLKPGTVKDRARKVIDHAKRRKGTAKEKADLYEGLAKQIEEGSGGSREAVRSRGADGSEIFYGRLGEALVIAPDAAVYRGKVKDIVDHATGDLLPNYDRLTRQ